MTQLDEIKSKVRPLLAAGRDREAINRIFKFDECYAFRGVEPKGFEIIQSIADFFKIPVQAIQIIGSAQTGYSIHKDRPFIAGVSDLDVAIIHPDMFILYSELCYKITKRYRDNTLFTPHDKIDATEVEKRFREYLSAGYLRPDYMPQCQQKRDWLQFFERLNEPYLDLFRKITCGIYISDGFFSGTQQFIINKLKDKRL